MNELVLTIAPDEFGIGDRDGLEPVIDGVSLVDVLKWVDGEIEHAGLTDIEAALTHLSFVPVGGEPRAVRLLGCGCGVDDCTSVVATISTSEETVTWSRIRWHAVRGKPIYENVGPFVFERAQYLSAVEHPVRAEVPVREQVDHAALAAGMPNDHAAWLRAMTMAFGRDFFTPGDPEMSRSRNITVQALRAFASGDHPLPERAVREWAVGRNFSERAIESYVGYFRDLTAQAQTPF